MIKQMDKKDGTDREKRREGKRCAIIRRENGPA